MSGRTHNQELQVNSLADQTSGENRPPYLVYTSAGNYNNLAQWISGERLFDVWATFYAEGKTAPAAAIEYVNHRKGAKFPNLHAAYQEWPEVFRRYRSIFVLDDDIEIETAAINRLFQIADRYKLDVLQPAFRTHGRISHEITRYRAGRVLRYTNYVEVTCPLFRQDVLENFLRVYDPRLVGWGIDWWFLQDMGPDLRGRVAIVDSVPCTNPDPHTKGRMREIDILQPSSERRTVWAEIKKEHGITTEDKGFVVYDEVLAPFHARIVAAIRESVMTLAVLVGRVSNAVVRRLRRLAGLLY